MEWIKIDHENDRKGKTKPPIKELVLLGYGSKMFPEDSWVVSGYRDNRGIYWNQFMDKYTDASIYPTHWMPLPEPPKD